MNESTNVTVSSTRNYLPIDFGVTLSTALVFTFTSLLAANILSNGGRFKCSFETFGTLTKRSFLTLLSIFIFILDNTTDIMLTWTYWMDDYTENFWLSLTFTGLPTLVNIIPIIFVALSKDWNSYQKYIIVVVCVGLLCSPIIQYLVLTKILALSSNKSELEDFERMVHLLSIIETTFEAAPQIICQVYINLKSTMDENISTKLFRYFTVAVSVLGVAMTMYKVRHGDRKERKITTRLVLYLLSIVEIGPRVVILAVFVHVVGIYCVIFFVAHIVMILIIAIIADYGNMKSENDKFKIARETMILLLTSFAKIFFFCEYNLFDNNTQFKKFVDKSKIVFYILYYIENAVLLAIYIILTRERNAWYFFGSISIGIVGFVLHIILYKNQQMREGKDEPEDERILVNREGSFNDISGD